MINVSGANECILQFDIVSKIEHASETEYGL